MNYNINVSKSPNNRIAFSSKQLLKAIAESNQDGDPDLHCLELRAFFIS